MNVAKTGPLSPKPGALKTWILAARPKTLWAAVAPVLIGTAMAFGDGLFYWPAAAIALLGALLIQIGTNLANDYYDFRSGADDEKRLGPLRVTQAGLVSPEQIKRAFIGTFALAFFSGLYLVWLGGWPVLVLGILSILFGVLYTGGPYPLGYNGLGDVFVLIFFGPVAVGGTYYVQAKLITWPVLVAGLGPGFIAVGLLAVNNLRDIVSDRAAGKRTLAVRFGAPFARLEYLASIVIPCLILPILIWMTGGHYPVLLALGILPVAIPALKLVMSRREGIILNEVLASTGKILLLYGVLFSIGWIV
ncbi:MAG: 1,4-dihydroxy-2-naphthoate polyprenyltransferase [Calditrichaeota bacterium]|nr:1,4-dihydroxy-2-naphthoate polyprenyltransferase [Calditrichota bacterium]